MSVESFPEIYHQINALQTDFALSVLDKVKDLFLIKAQSVDNLRSIDIGSGDGRVLKEIFIEKCGLNFSEVVGTDKSIDMVKFAREKYGSEKIDFHVLDIGSANLSENFGTFDVATSYFVFHWVKDLPQAIKNVQKVLKPGGIFHLYFCVDFSISKFYAPLLKKYKSMGNAINESTPPLQKDANFMENFKEILEGSGFTIELSEVIGIDYDFKTAETYMSKY